jgi:lipoprotein-releasing system ATP-binding protein
MDNRISEEVPEKIQAIESSGLIISIRNLVKTYKPDGVKVRVLRGLDLDIRAGEMVAVLGASGAGKSTLLHLVGALDRPTSGEVFFQGKQIFRLSNSELARFRNQSIGFVFQFHHLLPEFSALENVIIPGLLGKNSRQQTEARARKLIELVGLQERMSHRPAELSGGEQQRVAVARALVNRPAVVLADEPTGNLDSETADSIYDLLREINQSEGMTFLVVTHNETIAERMDRQVVMVDGRIAASQS